MEKAIKFLGVCFLICAILVCGTTIYRSVYLERYVFTNSSADGKEVVFDKITGAYYYYYNGNVIKMDYLKNKLSHIKIKK